jgi:chromosome segregation ATPase
MAVGGKQSKQDGWQHQADRLARKRTAVPALPRIATAQSPRHKLREPARPSVLPVGDDRRLSPHAGTERRDNVAKAAGKEFSREEALDWILNARKEAVAVRADRAKAAEARIADLEASLEVALARVAFLENENQSLQNSLDLTVSENLFLAKQLAQSETWGDEARSELQSSAMLRAEHDMAVSAAERKIELLQNLIAVKETRLQKLEETRGKMEQDANKLIETTRARDKALAEAELRILVLTELFEKLELRLDGGNGENDNRNPNPKPVAAKRADLQEAGRELRLWRRELDTDDWLLAGPARR